jgi:hypothetical protein
VKAAVYGSLFVAAVGTALLAVTLSMRDAAETEISILRGILATQRTVITAYRQQIAHLEASVAVCGPLAAPGAGFGASSRRPEPPRATPVFPRDAQFGGIAR